MWAGHLSYGRAHTDPSVRPAALHPFPSTSSSFRSEGTGTTQEGAHAERIERDEGGGGSGAASRAAGGGASPGHGGDLGRRHRPHGSGAARRRRGGEERGHGPAPGGHHVGRRLLR